MSSDPLLKPPLPNKLLSDPTLRRASVRETRNTYANQLSYQSRSSLGGLPTINEEDKMLGTDSNFFDPYTSTLPNKYGHHTSTKKKD